MISGFGWAALALLFGYLALFFWASALAAKGSRSITSRRPVAFGRCSCTCACMAYASCHL